MNSATWECRRSLHPLLGMAAGQCFQLVSCPGLGGSSSHKQGEAVVSPGFADHNNSTCTPCLYVRSTLSQLANGLNISCSQVFLYNLSSQVVQVAAKTTKRYQIRYIQCPATGDEVWA